MYNKKSNGPTFDPWGAPQVKVALYGFVQLQPDL